jgi:HEAT repeat protein
MSISTILQKTVLVAALVAVTAMAQTPYDDGQKALRDKQWVAAAELFEQAIEAGGEKVDASMYWRAYALYESRRDREAERQLRKLERTYPQSPWLKEAQVLRIEHGDDAPANTDDDILEDEELRMFALARLMERDPERALPLVMKLLQETQSDDVRRDALFMLGMSDEEAAQKAIAQIAVNSEDPRLQAEAIQMLGFSDNPASLALLAGLYTQDADDLVKRAVLEAYMVSDDPAPLVEMLRQEQDPKWQKQIIQTLGILDATEELQGLYPTLESVDIKKAALEAFFIAGDTAMLKQVLETETDPGLRKAAIQGIAMESDEDTPALLESIYDEAQSVDEKRAVLESLVMMDHAGELALKIVRTESDAQLRRQAIQVLGIVEATDELAELYASIGEPALRRAVLEALMIADDTEGLLEVLQSEQDPEMRSTAIEMLAVSGDRQAREFLVGMYPQASRREKGAIIEAMLIMNDAKGLISLMKTESDPGLQREMMQMLSHMDSEAADDYLFELLEKNR